MKNSLMINNQNLPFSTWKTFSTKPLKIILVYTRCILFFHKSLGNMNYAISVCRESILMEASTMNYPIIIVVSTSYKDYKPE